jgi:hypothetical protein
MSEPFHFQTQLHLPVILGPKAKNPIELLECIKKVPETSIYYHTHHFILKHHYLSPTPSNDFAYWVSNILGMAEMGERLESVDTVTFKKLEDLRNEFITIISDEIQRTARLNECQRGEEFFFMSCLSTIMPTAFVVQNVSEFLDALTKVSINSIYFHFFEAPLRLGRLDNDFTIWLRKIGSEKFAQQLTLLDPYTMTLEELRDRIIRIGKKNHAA